VATRLQVRVFLATCLQVRYFCGNMRVSAFCGVCADWLSLLKNGLVAFKSFVATCLQVLSLVGYVRLAITAQQLSGGQMPAAQQCHPAHAMLCFAPLPSHLPHH
jgi:hypothetical protein